MSDPIRTKPKSSMQIDNAPTPHNTPASVLNPSYLKNGNPVRPRHRSRMTRSAPSTRRTSWLTNPVVTVHPRQTWLAGRPGQREFQVEMFEPENKFLQKYKPIWEQRSRIISGQEQPKPEQIAKGQEIVKGIPSFWLTALENLPIVCDTITDRDAEVLEYLQDIGLEYLTDGRPGFKLLFRFDSSANPFFTNNILCKTYFYQKELGYSGTLSTTTQKAARSVEGQRPQRHCGPRNAQAEKQDHQAGEDHREDHSHRIFFQLLPDPPKIQNEDQDEELEEDLEERLALDYSIGEQLRTS
ncbi:AIF_collapsed_G0032110.mRNA.1.CDS.1 [Saccharomyces cerevisiae]|nr:AIF_collapsed_G0032110.mRNA.1.CDS.1 [Saccharomyces cerevisiae]